MKSKCLNFFWLVVLIGASCQSPKNKNQEREIKITSSSQKLPKLPKTITFFGQIVRIEDADITERLDREVLVNTYFQSSTSLSIKRAQRYFPTIEKILKEKNIPDDFKYLCVIESNLSNAESPAGAMGFWQFMPQTAEEFGLKVTNEIDERKDYIKSTKAACELIRSNHDTFNDWVMACAAYNRGAGGLKGDMNFQKVQHFFDTEMNQETARYVFRIMALKLIMEKPKAYGYNISKESCYEPYQTQGIEVVEPINDLSLWAINHGTTRKNIRILNPWILGNTLTKNSIPCTLLIPQKNSNLTTYSKP